eukprot:9755456-Alexandrium_andersonii.AAC.1
MASQAVVVTCMPCSEGAWSFSAIARHSSACVWTLSAAEATQFTKGCARARTSAIGHPVQAQLTLMRHKHWRQPMPCLYFCGVGGFGSAANPGVHCFSSSASPHRLA